MSVQFKAGMESVDLEMLNSMLDSFSQGTYFQEKLRRDEEKSRKYCELLLRKLKTIPSNNEFYDGVDKYISGLESTRDLSRTFIHIDMDAFYAYVEEHDDPSLKGKPVAVGSMDMLVTSNYVARQFGIRSGIPGMMALKICPTLIIKPQRMDRYRQVSAVIRNQMRIFDENFISPSLDEGCMDITKFLKENVNLNAIDVAKLLQHRVYETTGLTCSMGIAPSPMLAKICSETNKPNGYFMLDKDIKKLKEYVNTIPVKKVNGIGKTRQRLLEILGVTTIEDVIENRFDLYYILPEGHRDLIFKHAYCIPIFPQESSYFLFKKRTMISKEKSCKEIYDNQDLNDLIENLYLDAIKMLYNEQKIAKGLIVKIQDFKHKDANFTFSLVSGTPPPSLDIDGMIVVKEPNADKSNVSSETLNHELPEHSFQENSRLIRLHFFNTVLAHRFDQIRTVGLKLVNLIEF